MILGAQWIETDDYLLASLPPDEREQTVARLRRANAGEFRRMRETTRAGTLGHVWPDGDSRRTPGLAKSRPSGSRSVGRS